MCNVCQKIEMPWANAVRSPPAAAKTSASTAAPTKYSKQLSIDSSMHNECDDYGLRNQQQNDYE